MLYVINSFVYICRSNRNITQPRVKEFGKSENVIIDIFILPRFDKLFWDNIRKRNRAEIRFYATFKTNQKFFP